MDEYAGLDQFGWLISQLVTDSDNGGEVRSDADYEANRNGSPKFAEEQSDVVLGRSSLYSYDNLSRLTQSDRGRLNSVRTDIVTEWSDPQQVVYTMDILGNMEAEKVSGFIFVLPSGAVSRGVFPRPCGLAGAPALSEERSGGRIRCLSGFSISKALCASRSVPHAVLRNGMGHPTVAHRTITFSHEIASPIRPTRLGGSLALPFRPGA